MLVHGGADGGIIVYDQKVRHFRSLQAENGVKLKFLRVNKSKYPQALRRE